MELKERRELYKAMRSAHDGICPGCGGFVTTSADRDVWCVSGNRCNFSLNNNEIKQIKSWHDEFHINLPAILEKWRKE